MTEITYPGPQFPGPAGVSVYCPDGWDPAPDLPWALALIKKVDAGVFRPNVIVSVRRMAKGTALPTAVKELHDRAATLKEYTPIGEETREIAGWPGVRMEGSFIDATAGTLVQAICLVAVDRGKVEDLVQITGTCHAKQVPDALEQIRTVQKSMVIQV